MIDKFRSDAAAAVAAIPSGATLAVGGFGSSGRPDTLLDALCDLDRRDLHVIVNNVGSDFTGIGRLLAERRIRRLTASFPVLPEFYDEYFAGRVELELIPQGRSRSGCGQAARAFPPSSRRPELARCSPTAPSRSATAPTERSPTGCRNGSAASSAAASTSWNTASSLTSPW